MTTTSHALPSVRLLAPLGLSLVLSLALPQPASAQRVPARSAYVERVHDEAADYLTAIEERFGRGDYRGGAVLVQDLLLLAQGPEGAALVPISPPGLPFDAEALDPPDTVYETLTTAVYRRLRALPPRGKRLYEAAIGGEAKERIARAASLGHPRRLAEVEARFLFTEAGDALVLQRGDEALEAGDLTAAACCYRLLAVDRGDPARVASRVRALAAAQRPARASANRALGGPEPWLGGAKTWLGAPPRRTRVASSAPWLERRDPSRLTLGLGVVAAPSTGEDQLVCALPGGIRVLPADRERAPWSLPAGAGEPAPSARMQVGTLAWTASDGVLVAGVEVPRLFAGDAAMQRRDPRAGTDTGQPSLDLFAFDLAREGRLLWTTAEVQGRDEDTAAWLASVSWSGTLAASGATVVAVGVARRAEAEVHAAGFDARTGTLRWRRMLCAYSMRGRAAAPQPHVALADGVAVVEVGLGMLAALSARTGEVRWLAKERPARADDDADVAADFAAGTARRDPQAAPAVRVLATTPPVALWQDPRTRRVEAIDLVTGARRWAVRGHWPAEVLAVSPTLALLGDADGIWLIDGVREGRAISQKLPLPPRASVASARILGDRVVLALEAEPGRGARELLLLRIRALDRGLARLHPIGLLPTRAPLSSAPTALPSGELAYLAGEDLVRIPLGPRSLEASANHARAVGTRYDGSGLDPVPLAAAEAAPIPGSFRVVVLPSGEHVGDIEAILSDR